MPVQMDNPFEHIDKRFDHLSELINDLRSVLRDREAPKYITVKQAGEILGVSKPTVYALINQGLIGKYQFGSVKRLLYSEVINLPTRINDKITGDSVDR